MSQVHSAFPLPVFLGAPVRTPIGKFGGTLKRFGAAQLASFALKAAIDRSELGMAADWVFLGQARQAGAKPNPARQATIASGLPETVPAMTLNQACASGFMSIIAAAEKIALRRGRVIYAGGIESMSNTPYYLMQGRWGLRMGHSEIIDGMTLDGFQCPMANMLMGATVDQYLAKEMNISRKEQDEFALRSQQLAEAAYLRGDFKSEIIPIAGDEKNPGLDHDEHRRGQTTLEQLAKLAPVFDPKAGTVTAGNSSGITDGAAFFCVTADRQSSTVAELIDYEVIALDPKKMGLGPVESTRRLLKRQGLSVGDVDAYEINEAFAAQALACNRELDLPLDRLNSWGGAIALGHPIGATGARILVTLTSRLRGQSGALGLATLCVSGGQGVAVLIRMV